MIKTPNFKETKTCLKDLISQHTHTKPSHLQKYTSFNWIQQSTPKNSNSNILYDEFIYTDKLTKKRIRMRDAKTTYQKGRHTRKSSDLQLTHINLNQQKKRRQSRKARHNSNSDLQKQLSDLNECFVMLKSTEMFKLNSLRQKIFGSVDRSLKNTTGKQGQNVNINKSIQGNIGDMLLKKKKIRQILQNTVKQANINEFRRYFSNENHKINHKIVSMNHKIPKSCNKSNIQKIISTLACVQKKDQNVCTFIKKQVDDIQFPGQSKLKYDLIEYMKKQIKQNGEYLITPQKNKLLYQRLYHNAISKNKDIEENQYKAFQQNNIANSINTSQDQNAWASKLQINIPSQSNLFSPIVNQSDTKSNNNRAQLKKKTSRFDKQKIMENCFIQKKQKHKKENTCMDLNQFNMMKYQKQNIKPSKITNFLKQFSFSPCQKSRQISMIKTKFEKNKRLTIKNLSLKQQRFLFMVENGLLFDVQKQILLNEQYLFIKDQNQNNLLHICAKNHFSEMFGFIIQRYKKCSIKKQLNQKWGQSILKQRLLQKNKNNKNVLQVARLYQAQDIVDQLLKLKQQMNIREYND